MNGQLESSATAWTRLVLPGFIQPRSVKVADSKLGIDIFYLAFEFLRAGLDNRQDLRWSPDKIRTSLRYIYPFFDSFVNLFVQSLKEADLLPDAFEKTSPWPRGASFALGLSHDLDILRRRIPGGAAMLVKSVFSNSVPGGVGGSIRGLLDSLTAMITFGKNPYRAFDKWFDIENNATYFIFSGKRRSSSDPTYKLRKVSRELSSFDNENYEIALHNGIGTWSDPAELAKQRSRLSDMLKTEIRGIRPHYLDFQLSDFWKNIEGFGYSSSIGSDEIPGFAGGINFPFFGIDFETCEAFDILEMPIGLMDCALFSIKDKTLRNRTLNEIIKTSIAGHGLLVLDWHVRTAYRPDFPGWLETYLHVLDEAKSAGAYIAPLGEIDKLWRQWLLAMVSRMAVSVSLR